MTIETRNNPMPGQSHSLPNDLSLWIEKNSLVSLVLEAVHDVTWPEPELPSAHEDGCPSAMLRTLVLYCYATGTFSSKEIEDSATQDKMVRYLCANDYPRWQTIRRFRRANSPFLTLALMKVLQRAWARRAAEVNINSPQWPGPALLSPKPMSEFMAEASNRINRAIQADSMAMDE